MAVQRFEAVGEAVSCNLCGEPVFGRRDRVWRKDGHDILRCPSCGLTFRADLPDAEALSEIYGPEYFADSAGELRGQGYLDYLGDEEEHRVNARKRLRLLRRYTTSGHLLDVGCAAGFFLDEARRSGWTVAGVDVSQAMADYARDRALPVRATPFLGTDFGDSKFDTVTMWDYIEHVIDPKAEFRRASDLLRPSGILALSTGDAGSAVARISGSRWHLLTPRHHNFFFTRRQLIRYLEEQDFEVLATKYLWSSYSAAYLAHKAQMLGDASHSGRVVRALEGRPFRQLQIPMNFFDIVTVIARKLS